MKRHNYTNDGTFDWSLESKSESNLKKKGYQRHFYHHDPLPSPILLWYDKQLNKQGPAVYALTGEVTLLGRKLAGWVSKSEEDAFYFLTKANYGGF